MKQFTDRQVYVVCIILFAVNYLTYTPGFLTPDSITQYGQALSGQYESWHPVAMALWWSILNLALPGSGLMLAFQLMLLWAAVYRLATTLDGKWWRIGILAFFFLAPFIQNFAGAIIKDMQMAFAWLLAMAILIKAYVKNQRITTWQAIITALLLLYGGWVRHNSPAGLLTLGLVWGWLVFIRQRVVVRIATGIALVGATMMGGSLLNKTTGAQVLHPEQVLYLHDLVSFEVLGNVRVYPEIMYRNPGFDTAYIRGHSHPATSDHLWWNPDGKVLIHATKEVVDEMGVAWKHAIKTYPGIYLHNRYITFLYFLHIRKSPYELQVSFPWVAPNDYCIVQPPRNFLREAFDVSLNAIKSSFIFLPWFWLLLNFVLCALVFRMREKTLRFIFACLMCSTLFYVLPQFFLASTDKDLRYIYWQCIGVCLAVIVFAIERKVRHNPHAVEG